MEENQIQNGLESSDVQIEEPTSVDNSLNEKEDTVIEEKSTLFIKNERIASFKLSVKPKYGSSL